MKQKFTLLFLLSCCAATFTFAQINKGSVYAGGSFSLTTQKYKSNGQSEHASTFYSIAPSFGYAYNTNRIIGGSLFYAHSPHDSATNAYDTYGLGVFLRQYKMLGKGVYVFANEGLNYSYYNYERYGEKQKNSSIALSLNPGLAYDLTHKMQLEMLFPDLVSLSYNVAKDDQPNYKWKQSNFNINSFLNGSALSNISIGFRFYLTRK